VSYSTTSANPTATSTTRTISLQVTDVGTPAAANSTVTTNTVNLTAVNNNPTLTVFSAGAVSGLEDSTITIRYSDLIGNGSAQGQVADADGSVNVLEVRELLSGSLLLGATQATATPYSATSNAQIDANTHAYWTPVANANGTGNNALSAFTVVARDNSGAVSVPPRTVLVDVTADQSDAALITKVSLPANGTYSTGDNLLFSIEFDRAVTVNSTNGTPSLPITLDTGSGASASYLSGTGTNTLLFQYTVRAGDFDSSGIAVAAALNLNGAQITSIDDGQPVNSTLTLPGFASTTGLLVDGINDAPQISSTATLPLSYREGDPALLLNPELTLTDRDSTQISAASIAITAGFTAGDVLSLPITISGITATYDAATGVLSLTGNASPTCCRHTSVKRSGLKSVMT
jgi:hypothetical protein